MWQELCKRGVDCGAACQAFKEVVCFGVGACVLEQIAFERLFDGLLGEETDVRKVFFFEAPVALHRDLHWPAQATAGAGWRS